VPKKPIPFFKKEIERPRLALQQKPFLKSMKFGLMVLIYLHDQQAIIFK